MAGRHGGEDQGGNEILRSTDDIPASNPGIIPCSRRSEEGIVSKQQGKHLICSCCVVLLAARNSGDMKKSAKEKCCDAISKGLTRITAIVRPIETRYIACAEIL